MKDRSVCNCDDPVKGLYICLKCAKPLVETNERYKEYLHLCDVYGEEIAKCIVYG